MVKVKKDLTGQKFGRLTVIKQTEDYVNPNTGVHSAKWECQCECGKITNVTSGKLTSGNTKSCGCLHSEFVIKKNSRQNKYEIKDDYVIIYTSNKEPIYVDLEDFDKVKNICWHINNLGYVVGCINRKKVFMHRLIMDCPKNYCVDHKRGKNTRNDNRKSNLRIATNTENSINIGLKNNNSSGVTGVSWHKASQKWRVRINIGYQEIYLGVYDNFTEAVNVRKQAEEKYFGEWSYNNSQMVNDSLKENDTDGNSKKSIEYTE